MIKRLFDILTAALALLVLLPLLLVVAAWVSLSSPGGAFFRQVRVGKEGRHFKLVKFRSMRPGSEAKGQITTSERDPRVTTVGTFLRRTKLDELPQLWNVLIGDMSIVGPRPEVPKYVALYTPEQRRLLLVRPGITSLASIAYIDENAVLGRSTDPERTYVDEVLPTKLAMDLPYVEHGNFMMDLRILGKTLVRILCG